MLTNGGVQAGAGVWAKGGLDVGTSPSLSINEQSSRVFSSITKDFWMTSSSGPVGFVVRQSTGNVEFGATLYTGHLAAGWNPPTVAANSGAGTSPTISVDGYDNAFIVTLTAGTSPVSGADIFTITFYKAFEASPKGISVFPLNQNTCSTMGNIYATPGTTTLKISLASGASLIAGQQYKWSFTLIQ